MFGWRVSVERGRRSGPSRSSGQSSDGPVDGVPTDDTAPEPIAPEPGDAGHDETSSPPDPGEAAPDGPPQIVSELRTLAHAALDEGRFRDAATLFGESLRLEPDATEVHAVCARMFVEVGEFGKAETHFLLAVDGAPEDPSLALQLGCFYKSRGRIREAAAAFERASALKPDWSEPTAELERLREQGWRGESTEPAPDTHPETAPGHSTPEPGIRDFGRDVSDLQRAAEVGRLIPELVPRTLPEMLRSHDEVIELLRFGQHERTHWGWTPTFRGVEAIRGYCLSPHPISELQVSLNGLLVHRGPVKGGFPLPYERNRPDLLKYVFNVWLDLSPFAHGRYELELRFDRPGHDPWLRREHLVIAEPLAEADHPDSDGIVTLAPSDPRSPDEQINARPSMVRSAARTALPGPIRNILILRTDQLGDLVTSIPALRRLKQLFPQANVVGLLTSANADLARTLGLFDEVIVADFPEDALQRRRTMTLEAQADLRARLAPYRFDLALDLASSGMSRILLLLSGAPFLYGFDEREWPWLTAGFDGRTQDRKNRREMAPHSTRVLAFIERLGTLAASGAAVIRRADLSREALASRYGLADGRRFAVLHTGARIACSRWAHYPELAEALIDRTDLAVVLITDDPGTKGRLPPGLLEAERFRFIDERLPFDVLDALLHDCTVFVGNDSGPKHLAALRGVGVVSIHSARVNWNEWGQELVGSIVSRRVPCAGCTIYFDAEDCGHEFDCVTRIGLDEVFEAVMRQIEAGPAGRSLVGAVEDGPAALA